MLHYSVYRKDSVSHEALDRHVNHSYMDFQKGNTAVSYTRNATNCKKQLKFADRKMRKWSKNLKHEKKSPVAGRIVKQGVPC